MCAGNQINLNSSCYKKKIVNKWTILINDKCSIINVADRYSQKSQLNRQLNRWIDRWSDRWPVGC